MSTTQQHIENLINKPYTRHTMVMIVICLAVTALLAYAAKELLLQ